MHNLWQATAEPPPESESLTWNLKADVAVIGAGFTGCAAALRLAQAGTNVCLIEAQDVGYGASGRSVGLVNAGLWVEPNKIIRALGQEKGQLLNDILMRAPGVVFGLIEEHDIACEATRAGTLYCAHAQSGFRKLEHRAAQLIAAGASIKLLSSDEAHAKTGSDAFHGALFYPSAGTIQPLSYVRGLASAATKAGAKLFTRSGVKVLTRVNQQWRAVTARGSITAKSVILTTNAYTACLDSAALPSFVPIHYCQFATAPLAKDLACRILPERHGVWDTATVMSSFRMDNSDRLIIGGIGRLDGVSERTHRAWAARKLRRLFPMVPANDFEFGWSGCIAMTADHMPKIVRIGPSGLMVYGYNGRGIAPGTVFGALLADYILTNDESVLPLPILDRYRESLRLFKSRLYEAGASAVHFMSGRKR